MQIRMEMDGTNPRTGLPDTCYLDVQIDDELARRAQTGRKTFIMREIEAAVDKLLEQAGDK